MVFNSDIRNGFVQYGQSLQSLNLLTGSLNGQTELLAKAVQNLTPKQQALALATKGVSQETIAEVLALNQVDEKQIQQVLLDTALVQRKKELTTTIAQEAIMAQGLTEAKTREIMTSAGIIAGNDAEVISKKQVSVATLEAKLAQEGLSAAQIKAITTQLGLGTSTLTLSNYFKGLGASITSSTKAMATFLFTTPMGWLTLVGTALAGVIALVNKYNQKQEEARQTAIDSANAIKQQASSMEDLVSQYETILDSEKSDAEKTVELNKWKQTLVETYKIERDELRKLNTDREHGIQLLEDEIDATNRRNRNKWLGENKDLIEEAIEKINNPMNIGGFAIDFSSVDKDIKEFLSYDVAGQYRLKGDNLIEQYESLEQIIGYLGDKNNLTNAEEQLLSELNRQREKAEKILSDYREIYETYYDMKSENLFQDYAVDANAIENVSQETYQAWKNGLIKTANGDHELEKALETIAEEQFPDYAEYFDSYSQNLTKAYNMFINKIKVNSPDDVSFANQVADYIDSLSNEELSILLTFDENVFDKGIGIVKRKIAKFKQENPVEVNFKISDYQEQIETVNGNIKTLQDALDKLDSNEFDFTNDIYDLANAFPEYSTEILNASGDTEKLRKVLQELLNSQPNDLIKSLTELKGSLTNDEDIRAVDNLIRILKNSTSSTEVLDALVQSFDDLSSAVSTFTKNQATLKEAFEEQEKHGQLSADTIQSLTEAGYAQALSVNAETGAITLNKQALEELNQQKQIEIELSLDKKETDLITAYEEEKTKISELNKELAHTNSLRAQEIINELTALEVTHKLTAEQLAQVRTLKKSLTAPTFGSSGGSGDDDKPESVKTFEAELAKRQHEINLGLRKEDASYYDWLEKAAKDAYSGIEDYEEDLWKYEEQVYEWRKNNEQDLFDHKIENLDKEKEKALENNDFSTAKTSVNTQITETRKRIVELKTSGKQDVDDEIKELEEDLDDLNDTLNDINSKEYEFNISIKEDSIEDLEKEFEKSGDISIYDKQIGIYTGLIADTQDEINRLLDLGYSKESDEIQELVDQIDEYSEDIADIWEKQTDVIKYNVDEQIEALDRNIENTGDTKLYSEKIKVYKDGQQQILDMIEFYREQGYAEDSAIIKELKKQWNDYQDSISDALQEQANAQVEAYNKLLDEQKELLEQQKEAQDEYYDSEIKALEDKKKALEEVNEVIEEQNELEEKRQSLAEAERNLYKNVRLVYTNGQWVQKAREEDLQAVKDAEKDISDTLRKQEIEALENQITALEEAKSEFDESIDKQITAIEESEKAFEKAMENSYKVRQQLDYEFISSIVGEDKAKEYQTNADNALKAIGESEKTDNADNSALIDSNNAVAESNKEVADSNVQVAESNSKLGDIQGKGAERNVDTTDTQENTDTISPLEIDSETRVVFNNLLKKANAFLKNIPIEEFNKLLNNNLKSALDTAPKIADDVDKSKMVMNVVNNVTNAPVVNTTVNVDGRNKSDEEIANIVANTAESKVTQALTAFVQGANNRFTKMMYGNT